MGKKKRKIERKTRKGEKALSHYYNGLKKSVSLAFHPSLKRLGRAIHPSFVLIARFVFKVALVLYISK